MDYCGESPFLDLKRSLHGFEYAALTPAPAQPAGLYASSSAAAAPAELSNATYLFFEEKTIVLRDISNLQAFFEAPGPAAQPHFPFREVSVRIAAILQKYMEQPSLLDAVIEPVVTGLIAAVRAVTARCFEAVAERDEIVPLEEALLPLGVVFSTVVKVRTLRNVRKYMSHEAADLERLLVFLLLRHVHGGLSWEAHHLCFSWLAVTLLVPFDFARLDAGVLRRLYARFVAAEPFPSLELLVLDFLRRSLRLGQRPGEAVAGCVAVLLGRPGLASACLLEQHVRWAAQAAAECLRASPPDVLFAANLLESAAKCLSSARSAHVRQVAHESLSWLRDVLSPFERTSDALLRHKHYRFLFRLVERSLPPRRSRRVARRVLDLGGAVSEPVPMLTNSQEPTAAPGPAADEAGEAGEECEESLALLEQCLGLFISALFDRSTPVRVMAARELGKVAARLPADTAEEICFIVLGAVESDERHLHGACLALAEFCLADALTQAHKTVVHSLLNASLFFEEVQGEHTTGGAVRDAACYVAWALARAPDRSLVGEWTQALAASLLLCACFDTEGTCRRAAAAAFQENVGRQGDFPAGIPIISEMDYFAVSAAHNAYLRVAPFVASFAGLAPQFFEHLLGSKAVHPDREVRVLAAHALGLIGLLVPQEQLEAAYPRLARDAKNRSLVRRHGALSCLAALIMALVGRADLMLARGAQSVFKATLLANDRRVVRTGEFYAPFERDFGEKKRLGRPAALPALEALLLLPAELHAAGLLRGKGGEATRTALCLLVRALCFTEVPLQGDELTRLYFFLEESLRTGVEDIQVAALLALEALCDRPSSDPRLLAACLHASLDSARKEQSVEVKRALISAVRAFPSAVLADFRGELVAFLCAIVLRRPASGPHDPTVRQAALASLTAVLLRLGGAATAADLAEAVGAILAAICDFTVDKRGDIGLAAREQGVTSAREVLELAASAESRLRLSPEQAHALVAVLFAGLFEPSDRLRLVAGSALQAVFRLLPRLPALSFGAALAEEFSPQVLSERFEAYQRQHFASYDVSLLDDQGFLDYRLNADFVYFWNLPQCVFPHVVGFVAFDELRPAATRGLMLSIADSSAATSHCAGQALSSLLQRREDLCLPVLAAALDFFRANARREKVFVACLKALTALLVLEAFPPDPACDLLLETLVPLCRESSASVARLNAAGTFLCAVLLHRGTLASDRAAAQRSHIEHYLFSDYPVVRRAFGEQLYLLLLARGEQLYGSPAAELLCEALGDPEGGPERLEEFTLLWRQLFPPSPAADSRL